MSASNTLPQVNHDVRFRQEAREAFDTQISQVSNIEDKRELLGSIQNFSVHFIKEALRTPAEAEQELAILWHMFIEAAKVIGKDDDDVCQQKLVALLLWTKEYDALRRSLHPAENTSITWEFYSYYFADTVQASWEQLLATPGTASQQCNLAAFSASTLAVGQDSLGSLALWYLREALETDGESNTTLLPAAVIWIETCSLKLLTFSAINHSYAEHAKMHLLTPGPRAQKTGIKQHGFSLERWTFWRQRFQELSRNVNPAVAKKAKEGFMCMISCGRQLDYDVPGEAKFAEKLHAAMETALVQSGKDSVDGDEIDIDVNWMD